MLYSFCSKILRPKKISEMNNLGYQILCINYVLVANCKENPRMQIARNHVGFPYLGNILHVSLMTQIAISAQPVFFSITWTYLEICRVNLKFKASLPNPYIKMQMCTLDIKKIKSVPIKSVPLDTFEQIGTDLIFLISNVHICVLIYGLGRLALNFKFTRQI